MNILLIEDDAGLVKLITAILEESGFSVMSANSGAKALTHLKKQIPDLMLLDYSLPDINGQELIQTLIKQQTPTPPFIITTGQGDESIAVDMMKLGAMDYLVKDRLFLEKLPDVVKRVTKEIESHHKLKRTEKALKESDERFKGLMKQSPFSIQILDTNGITTLVNSAFEKLWGLKFEDLKDYNMLQDEQLIKLKIMPYIEKAFAGEAVIIPTSEYNVQDTFGKGFKKWVQAHVYPVKDSIGKIVNVILVHEDITERKNAEDSLKESEDQLKFAQQSAGAGLWDWDMKTDKIKWSPELFSLFGFDSEQEETSFETWDKCMHPDDKESAHEKLNISIKEHTQLNNEYRVVHPNGKVVWINAIGNTSYDSEGNPIRNAGICIDITERRLVKESLLESNEKYLSLMDSLATGVVLHSPDTSIILSNPKASEILGISAEQLQGKKDIDPTWRFVKNDDTDLPLEEYPVNKALSSMKSFSDYIIGIKRPDRKNITWVNVNAALVFDENNNSKYITISFIDTTEQKLAEQEIQKSNALLSSIINSPENVIMLALDTNHNYLSFNKAHAKEMKNIYNADIEIGQDIFSYMPNEEDKRKADISYKRVLKGERFIDIQEYGEIGSRFWYELIYNPILDTLNQVTGFTIFVTNITEQKLAEEKLRESEKFSKEIIQSMLDGFSILDENGLHIDVNQAFCNMTGFTKEELIGVAVPHPYWPEEELENIQKAFEKISKGNFESFELVFKKKNGNRFPVLVSPSQIKDEKGYVVSNFAHVMDITERKQAEEELAKHNDHLEELVVERTRELEDKNNELDIAMKSFVGREFKIRNLEKTLKALKNK